LELNIFSKDFLDFIELLNRYEVKYIIVGGYAVAFHGYPRYTGDLEIWIKNSDINAERIISVLEEFGVNIPDLKKEDLTKDEPMTGLYFGKEPYKIDIIAALDGLTFDECYSNSVTIFINKIEIRYLSFDDLKKNKKLTGRLKDLADIEELEKRNLNSDEK